MGFARQAIALQPDAVLQDAFSLNDTAGYGRARRRTVSLTWPNSVAGMQSTSRPSAASARSACVRSIWAIIRGTRVFSGPDSILSQVLEAMGVKQDAGQLMEIIGIFKAILDAGMFFAKGTGPHLNYSVHPAIEYLRAP